MTASYPRYNFTGSPITRHPLSQLARETPSGDAEQRINQASGLKEYCPLDLLNQAIVDRSAHDPFLVRLQSTLIYNARIGRRALSARRPHDDHRPPEN